MYCSHCGRPARNRFCSHCGQPLWQPAEQLVATVGAETLDRGAAEGDLANRATTRGDCWPVRAEAEAGLVQAEVVDDWQREVRYEALIRRPEVRSLIDRHARLAKKGITGEQILAIYDQLVPLGVSMEKLAGIIQPLYAKMGIETGKEQQAVFPVPPGRMIVRALCFLARRGQAIRTVEQAADGCLLEAALPSDLWSLEGDLLIGVHERLGGTQVTATTRIPGQWFDWGKSRRCLDRLFEELDRDPG